MDITGRLAPVFFIGCGIGSSVFPPLSGFAFTSSLGPDSILYLTLGACVLQCANFSAMWTLSWCGRRRRAPNLELVARR